MNVSEENPTLGNQSLLLSRVKPADYILTFINLLGDTVLSSDIKIQFGWGDRRGYLGEGRGWILAAKGFSKCCVRAPRPRKEAPERRGPKFESHGPEGS